MWKLGDELRMVGEMVPALVEAGGVRAAMKLMRAFLPEHRKAKDDRLPEPDSAGAEPSGVR